MVILSVDPDSRHAHKLKRRKVPSVSAFIEKTYPKRRADRVQFIDPKVKVWFDNNVRGVDAATVFTVFESPSGRPAINDPDATIVPGTAVWDADTSCVRWTPLHHEAGWAGSGSDLTPDSHFSVRINGSAIRLSFKGMTPNNGVFHFSTRPAKFHLVVRCLEHIKVRRLCRLRKLRSAALLRLCDATVNSRGWKGRGWLARIVHAVSSHLRRLLLPLFRTLIV